jgi:hypothetical protein
MTWATLDDNMGDHPKIASLTDAQFRLYILAILYANRNLTDGFIPEVIAHKLVLKSRSTCAQLVAKSLLTRVPSGYQLRDFLDWNQSREQVLEARKARSRAGRIAAQRRWHPEEEDATTHANRIGARNAPLPSPLIEGFNLGQTQGSDDARFAANAARVVKSVNGNLSRPIAKQHKQRCDHDYQAAGDVLRCTHCNHEVVE